LLVSWTVPREGGKKYPAGVIIALIVTLCQSLKRGFGRGQVSYAALRRPALEPLQHGGTPQPKIALALCLAGR
jgi:hypothetical protein